MLTGLCGRQREERCTSLPGLIYRSMLKYTTLFDIKSILKASTVVSKMCFLSMLMTGAVSNGTLVVSVQ